jgi:hypothetical protein
MAPGQAAAATLLLPHADAMLPLLGGRAVGGDRYADPFASGPKSPDGCLSPRFGPETTSTREDPASDCGV